jgi:hypothetical protein
MLANEMWTNRHERYEKRMKRDIDSKGQKLNHMIEGENELADRENISDEKAVANMSMSEQIRFSTIQLSIYQTQQIRRELISNDKNIKEYEPGFGQKLINSLALGWNTLQAFLLFLAKIWGLIIFALLVYILYRYYRRNPTLSFEKIQPAKNPKE